MKSGCRGFILRLGTSVVSALLIAVGMVLLIFGISSWTPSSGLRVTLLVFAVAIVAYAFLRIGQGILQDMKEDRAPEKEKPNSENDPAADENPSDPG